MKRAEKHLLEALYGHISSLGKFESDTLMEEDPDVMQRRAATKKVHTHTHIQTHTHTHTCMHAHTHTTSLLLCRSAGLDNTMHLMHPETTFTPECEMALAHSFCTIA